MNHPSSKPGNEVRLSTSHALAQASGGVLDASESDRSHRSPSLLSMILRIVFASVISVVFAVALASHIHLSDLANMLRRAQIGWIVAGVVILGVANFARAVRFQVLDAHRHPLSYWWTTTQIYNFTTSTLPGGLGEFVTAFLFRRSSYVGWAGAFRLLVVARLLDLATLLGIFVAAMCMLGLAWASPLGAISCGVSAGLIVLALVLLIPGTQAFLLALLVRVIPVLPKRTPFIAKAQSTLQTLIEATSQTTRRAGIQIALWSLLMGLISASLVQVLLNGFGDHITYLQSCASYGLYVVLQLIPLQGIAGVGTQSARWAIALSLVGVNLQQATIDAVALYVCLYGIVAVWAILAALLVGILRLKRRFFMGGEAQPHLDTSHQETSGIQAMPVSMLNYPRNHLLPYDDH